MNRITIEPNVGKGATVVWETVPNVGDTVSWDYELQAVATTKTRTNTGQVMKRHFDPKGDVTLKVDRI